MQKYFTRFNIETKSIDETGVFAGYASMFNVTDAAGDVILPGAFKDTIKENPSIKLLWQHDTKEPIGSLINITENTKGLYIEGKILTELSRGKEAYNLIKSGVIDGLSIGFEVQDFFYGDAVRYIKKLKLWEISIVTFPANKEAKITDIKDSGFNSLSKALDRAITALKDMYGGRY